MLWNCTDVEIESDNWLDNVLNLSMDKTLCAEVESDIISIPKHQRGAITTLCCIIKHMVVRNHEARDALENYIKNFDITKFPGENVSTACCASRLLLRLLVRKTFPLTPSVGFSKVLANHLQPLSMSFVQVKLLCGVAASMTN